VDAIRSASKAGGFVKQNPKTKDWVEVGDDLAREKVGQLLREAMVRRNPAKLNERKRRRWSKALKKSGEHHERAQSSSKSMSYGTNSTCETSDRSSCTKSSDSSSVTDSICAAPTLPQRSAESSSFSDKIEVTRWVDPFDSDLLNPLPLDAATTSISEFDFSDLFF
jgi:hypothetical protein